MRQSQAINTELVTAIPQVDIILKALIWMGILILLPLQHQHKLRAEFNLVGQVLLLRLFQDGK